MKNLTNDEILEAISKLRFKYGKQINKTLLGMNHADGDDYESLSLHLHALHAKIDALEELDNIISEVIYSE